MLYMGHIAAIIRWLEGERADSEGIHLGAYAWSIRTALAALIVVVLFGCANRDVPVAQQPAFSRTVDLSHVVREDVPYLPDEPHTQLDRGVDGAFRQLQIGARTGTLLRITAAPDADVRTVDLLSPHDLVLSVVVIDVRDQAQDGIGYRLSAADLGAWEQRYGSVPHGTLVLLATGWDVRWGDAVAYLSPEGTGPAAVPAFGADAAAMLLDERGVIGLGVDAPGNSYTPASGYRLLLENLTNLEQLPPTGATVVVGALKLQAADRSPARVIALVP